MDIGPVQLIVFAFDKPKLEGGVAVELNRLKDQGAIRVVDALVVRKTAEGEIQKLQATDLGLEEAERFGAVLGGLLGLGAAGAPGMTRGAEIGSERVGEQGGHIIDGDAWDVLEDIPNDTAAALLLIEHRWAIPLRDAIRYEGGTALGDLWLHPRDLIAAGIIAADTAEALEWLGQEVRA